MNQIYYVPAPAAEALSRGLWNLSRPPALQQLGDTQLMFGWVDDLQGNRWLEVKSDFAIIIHPDAELGSIAAILQPWIDRGQLPADTNEVLAALVEAKRGQLLVVWEAFPPLFKDLSKTLEQMVAEGKLAAEENA
jgi:hypothetical protein